MQVMQRGTAVAPVLDRIRLERERPVIALDRFGLPAKLDQHVTAVAMGVDEIRIAGDGGVEARQCFGRLSETRERHSEQVMDARPLWDR